MNTMPRPAYVSLSPAPMPMPSHLNGQLVHGETYSDRKGDESFGRFI